MKPERYIIMAAAFLTFCGAGGCDDNVTHDYASFKDLCEDSGGVYLEENNVCKCDVECNKGVICLDGICADKLCSADGDTKCDNNKSFTCENNLWRFKEECKHGCLDDNKGCADCDMNDETKNRCEEGKNSEVCIGGKLEKCPDTMECTKDVCFTENIICPCVNGKLDTGHTKQCENNGKCVDGVCI